MEIGIVGLGLIGGSLARAVRARTAHTVWGADRNPEVIREAAASGAIDGELTDSRLSDCGLILVALYPAATVDWVRAHAGRIPKGAVVVDCAGVKETVCGPLFAAAREAGFTFIGGHPMAGKERTGFAHADPALFDGASMILVPEEGKEPPAWLEALFASIGFSRIQRASPAEHDAVIACTSQLAHVVSSAYVRSETAARFRGFSAGSFKDMTRVARLNADMWTELFFDNREPLLHEIDALTGRLAAYAGALRAGDREAMRALLAEGDRIKRTLENEENV